MRILGSLSALLVLTLPGLAQGTDSCTTPTPIAGLGPHAFNNGSAATGTNAAMCAAATRDVWFRWTAPSTAIYTVTTCGGASTDTVLAVYAGTGCPGAGALACNDDTCGLQSSATFTATAGADYVIQLASYTGTAGGSGTFSFTVTAPCTATVGPDVIVGDINGVSNYAAASGIDAIALGTTSCNLGDTWLNWISNTNQHPVIGGNLYRFRVVNGAGRFEQIGQSWLKHGFYALSQNLCCPNCAGTDGTHLGVGCSDPYTSARNGTQSGLGPRWQVNAATGVFTFPPANPAWSGGTARRLEFLVSDVDTSAGVRYFGEAQYVTPDDAAAGNQNNNASYRELSTNGTDFAMVGPTQRQMSAIEAWPACESGVSIANVQVPADGLFHVAHKVTSLGGGQYHYEYAVHNLNSHRSGGSFSIPIGTATITNIGFTDLPYRNGDGEGSVNRSGVDWAVTNTGGVLTWSTETEAQNLNANALRWGTTYNFRFDANVAPAAGSATLGLWRSGSPAGMTVPVEVPGVATSFAYCFGDGSGTACPCGNSGAAGNGCANSLNANGGNLAATGSSSITADSFVLQGSGMPNSSALYFQGTTQSSGGAGTAFGDGKRCAAGSVIRLGTKNNAGGASVYPAGGDQPVSIRGANAAGNVRTYQVWYRNAASFCTADTFNLTNGYQTTWTP
ncbi:MAG: hypothetical protein JNK02_01765 [Planctomycetes bacterium]|nr:hypothetical protein [Planctomycetota bacterium]